jgi:hypothetical protein
MRRNRAMSEPSKIVEDMAAYLAMAVSNAMEDFRRRHLTIKQMQELNPIIRDALCTALHAVGRLRVSKAAEEFVNFNREMIPPSQKKPTILPVFRQLESRVDYPADEAKC